MPPSKGARPNLSFKEAEAQHLSETVYFPMKPEWKPVNLTLYEVKTPVGHPVLNWIEEIYTPEANSDFLPSCEGFKQDECILEMYDGCGNIIETWVFENAWVQSVEFGDLDMASSDLVVCDLSIRYDRAYIQ